MTDSDEGLYDGDDMQYQINVTSDDERSSDASAHNEVETDNEGAGMVAEPQLNIEGDNRGGSGQLENDTQQQQCTEDCSEAESALPEMLAKEFASEEEAGICYQEYARTVGFGIRKHNKRRNVKGNITGRTWVCSRQGFRAAKHMENRCRGREAKAVTRTGCRAQFRVIYNEDTGRWACSFLQRVHNHNLTPPQLVHHIRSHRGVTGPDLSAALSLHKVGVKPSQIHEFMVDRSGGYDKVGYNRRDVENRLAATRHASLKESDAETCLSYLDGRKSSDPSFFYDFTITSSNRLGDLFWCDGGSCADYALFGDVIAFDATYKTNAYRKPLVVILGINHHRRTIVFGFALLSDETEHTYTWLLETLMTAMNNKHPRTVVTDGDKAMRNAISKTFPEASHRLCCWHLVRNAQTNIQNPEFTTEFRRCMMNAYTKEEFDRKWKLMVDNHNVAANEWVVKMFEDRHMWAEAYLRGKFFGGMRSTQRSEGMNAYLNHYVNRRLRLIEFVKQMDRLMDRQREAEGKDDFNSSDGRPVLVTHLKMYEQQAAEKFTRAMFRLVREEIDKEALLTAEMCDRDIMSTTYRVRRFGSVGKEVKVVINETSKTLSCTCKLLETIGIPCSHSFVVCKAQNMTEIPSSMILSRWSKAAKIKAHTSSDISCNKSHYMTELARIGQIYAACRSLLRFAGSSLAAYNVAITDIHQLTLKLQAMSHTEEPARQPLARRDTVVQDPEVVLTKGLVKKTKMGQPQQRKCSRCGQRGHNVRKCKKRGGTRQQLDDCSSHCMQFFCGSNVMGPNATDAADTNQAPQQPTRYLNVMSRQQIGENGRQFSPTSESWFQQFSASTASQSTDPTLNTSAFASVSNCIATSSSTPTNYAHIWNL
ncbi:protein FAR1-RELATED SEQUENCE 5-like [Citrus sinensis]|uniref:protein FAR1-RELATED SEQUENCE 5-like n=2 Tax=Citrus sinensis TaxID=2711 RepID=UPI002279945F|nr:protein FAR1-RELATED SEQUENCE 5-like [Citrus sinensis]